MHSAQQGEELTFEQSLKALEDIVEKMSRQSLSLDELIALYEDGIRYLHHCQENLNSAEMKINILNARIKQYQEGDKSNG